LNTHTDSESNGSRTKLVWRLGAGCCIIPLGSMGADDEFTGFGEIQTSSVVRRPVHATKFGVCPAENLSYQAVFICFQPTYLL
jgi:hypothetical protein